MVNRMLLCAVCATDPFTSSLGCGIYYRRILENQETAASQISSEECRHDTDTPSSNQQSHKRKRPDSDEYIDEVGIVEHELEDDIQFLRRVHIRSRRLTPQEKSVGSEAGPG